jgi:phosphatidylinositol alpha 1,6-mannosyltransferase
MRIAYFTESLPPLTDGVARTYTWLAEHLNSQGIDFRFYSPCAPAELEPWRGRVKAVPFFRLPVYSYYRVGWPWGQGLTQDLDAFKPEIVQVAAPTPLGLVGQAYALRRGLPLVSSYHTHFARYLPYYGLSALVPAGWAFLRWFHDRGLRTYAPSESAAAELRAHGFQRVALWERGLDSRRFSPRFRSRRERQRWAQPDEALLLYVGRLVADKDLRVLAQALTSLRQRGVRLRCVFAGDGPLKAELQAALPLDHFPGFVRGPALSRLYASADVFSFPSTNETFGNVVLEAMASGLPVVAAAAGGPADLIRSGNNGLLAQPKDAPDLARVIEGALADASLRRRLRAQGLVTARHFDWQRVHGRLVADQRAVIKAASPA